MNFDFDHVLYSSGGGIYFCITLWLMWREVRSVPVLDFLVYVEVYTPNIFASDLIFTFSGTWGCGVLVSSLTVICRRGGGEGYY